MCVIHKLALPLAALLVPALSACADAIVLRNGDQLSGSLIELADDVVVFRTELAGKMLVPVSQVTSIATSRDVQCVFKDGDRAVGRLIGGEDGMRFIPAGGDAPVPVTPSMLVSVAPQPRQAEPSLQATGKPTVDFSLETGAHTVAGSEDYIALYTRLRMSSSSETYRLLTDASLEFGETRDLPTAVQLLAAWQWRPGAALRPAVLFSLEHDTVEALDLRMTLGLGAYHLFLDNSRQLVEGTLGVSIEGEQSDIERLPGLDSFPSSGFDRLEAEWYYRTVGDHRDNFDLRATANVRHVLRLFKNARFEEQLSLYPSVTEFKDWRGAYESRFLFPLTDRLQLNLNLSIDYDSQPAYRYLDEWRAAVGAGIEWKF